MPAPATRARTLTRRRPQGSPLSRYTSARQAVLASFAGGSRIGPLWRGLTKAADELLAATLGDAPVALIAVGGYGRSELFPYSDIDVLLLVEEGAAQKHEDKIAALLQQWWDMQLPVSHATRTIAETVALASRDPSTAAALMDARLIAGPRKEFLALKQTLKRQVFGRHPHEFVEAKLRDRDARHGRSGGSRFLLEPNIKESKGSLRDLQTLNWLVRYCYGLSKASDLVRDDLLTHEEWQQYRNAYLFFATVRAHLHLLRGRADEKLTFDAQLSIAQRMKFPGRTPQQKAERLMMRYFDYARKVGTLTRIFCAILEMENLRASLLPLAQEAPRDLPPYLTTENGRLNFSEAADIEAWPGEMVGLFHTAHERGLDIHPRAQLLLSRTLARHGARLPLDGEANRLFLSLLTHRKPPDMVLRRMNDMGLIAALIPEFGRITGQMQYDGYHTYTVDEHTLVAVSNLHLLEAGALSEQFPMATAMARDITHRSIMYLAMLCHDIAKGTGGAHADRGETLVRHVAARFSLREEEAELAGWLVKHHGLMSEVAFKRDLDDPATIEAFAQIVQSPERLRLLLLITAADIRAVGPHIWNGWKGSLLRSLTRRALAQMGVGAPTPEADQQTQRMLQAWRASPERPVIEIAHDAFRAISRITCCMAPQPGMLRALAGVMGLMGASIVSARLLPHETQQGERAVFVSLGIQNAKGESFTIEETRLKQLPDLIQQALRGGLAFADELPRRRSVKQGGREVPVRTEVFFDNDISPSASVIEINARDRLGLLYDILGAMEAAGLQVMSAHISTHGSMAVDVFYVKDNYGHKLRHTAKQKEVRAMILRMLEEKA